MEESKSYRLFLRMENVTSVTNKNEAARRQDHQDHIRHIQNSRRAVAYHLLTARGPAVFVHPMALFFGVEDSHKSF